MYIYTPGAHTYTYIFQVPTGVGSLSPSAISPSTMINQLLGTPTPGGGAPSISSMLPSMLQGPRSTRSTERSTLSATKTSATKTKAAAEAATATLAAATTAPSATLRPPPAAKAAGGLAAESGAESGVGTEGSLKRSLKGSPATKPSSDLRSNGSARSR